MSFGGGGSSYEPQPVKAPQVAATPPEPEELATPPELSGKALDKASGNAKSRGTSALKIQLNVGGLGQPPLNQGQRGNGLSL